MEEKTLGFLGPQGTHSEAVALYVCGELSNENVRWRNIPYVSIYDTMLAVANGEIDSCVVPVENSLEGSINITLDTLAHEVDLQVEREIVWAVHNQLMVKDARIPVTAILSHPQPLAQCRRYLNEHYKDAEIKPVSSTAKAAAIAAERGGGYAAIAAERAAELYGLTVIAGEIQDSVTNCTRFLVLRKKRRQAVLGHDKTSLICQIHGEKAGSLCDVLLEFAKREVNLVRIESRPARIGLGEYIFFLCMDTSAEKANVKEALAAVQSKSLWMKNLGSFDSVFIDKKKSEKGGSDDGNYYESGCETRGNQKCD